MKELDLVRSLREIEDAEGRLTANAVVTAAENSSHPLHRLFDWNNDTAAHKHRLDTARRLIKSVEVRLTISNHTVRSVAYVKDPSLPGNVQGYRSVARVRTDPDDARAATVAEIARAAQHLRRARDLATALGSASEVETVLSDLSAMQARIQEPTAGQA